MNIVDQILFQCRRQPPAAAMCVPGPGIGLISYRRLEQFIHNFSRRLHALGLPERSIVAVSIEDVIFHTVAVLASIRLGIITVSIHDVGVSLPVKADLFISDGQRPHPQMSRLIVADPSWIEGNGHPIEPHLLPETHEDDLCRLIMTSGTSSAPKAVALSHKLLANRIARHATFGNRIINCSRIYSDLPISSSLGFQFLIYALSRGGMAFFPGPDFASTFRVIEDYKVQCLVGSPRGFETLLRWFDTIPAYQSSIEIVFCGGDVLSRSLSDRLRARICSHIVAAYGSTEASMSAVAHAHEIATAPRAVGFVTPGVVIEIVNGADGTVLPAGQEGNLRIRSEFAVDNYFGNPEESQKAFRDGWFFPGDTGIMRADGLLVITGREYAVLNLGGDKVKPEIIELVLGQFPGVAEAAAITVPNAYGNNEVCAVIASHQTLDEAALRAHCRTLIPAAYVPAMFHFVEELPHNEMGKLDRRRLHQLVQQRMGKDA